MPIIIQFIKVGLLPFVAKIPPPRLPLLLIILQLAIIGELPLSNAIPPPSFTETGSMAELGNTRLVGTVKFEFPSLIVKPSNLVVLLAALNKTTWKELSCGLAIVPISPLKMVGFVLKFRCVNKVSVPTKPP